MTIITSDPVVLTLWWIALGLTVLVIVPIAITLLHRTWWTARSIQRYTAETLAAGAGIASHTGNVPALDDTIETATSILGKAERIERQTATLENVLLVRARGAKEGS